MTASSFSVVVTLLRPGGQVVVKCQQIIVDGEQVISGIPVESQIQPRTLYCELVGTSSASVLWGPVSDAQQYILSIVGGQFVQPQQTSIQAGDVLKQSYNNLQPGTEYEICVLVIYNSNQQDLTFCKDIRTCPDDPQDVNIQSGSVTPTTVGLTWLSPSADKLDFYRIQVREPDGSLNPWTNVNVNEPRQFTVNFLQPDTEYCFQVDAVLSRTGQFAEQTNKNPVIRCQATDPVPQDVIIVRDVTNTSPTACEITIQWDDSGQDSGNYYLLFIYPPDQDRPSIQTDFVPTNLQMTTATYPFYNLNPGAEYMIDVIDSNQDVRSTVLRCRPNAPSNLQCSSLSSTSLRFTWSAPSGSFDNYQITYTPSNGSPASPISKQPTDARDVTLTNLLPNTNYDISIVTVAGQVMSGPLERSCQTNIAQPGEIIIREITDICVTFTWGEINLTFDNYLLQTLDEEDNSNVDTQVHDNVVITTFCGLTPGKLYTILLQTTPETSVSGRKSFIAKPNPIQSIQCAGLSTSTVTSVTVTWQPPASSGGAVLRSTKSTPVKAQDQGIW
ncbi:tenascin-R-like [Amphiura filiformis]|uniref:tenascin-R-like n=1 Tax=Amphiura filiformis TaxID=82378 RepID=UPI003B221027